MRGKGPSGAEIPELGNVATKPEETTQEQGFSAEEFEQALTDFGIEGKLKKIYRKLKEKEGSNSEINLSQKLKREIKAVLSADESEDISNNNLIIDLTGSINRDIEGREDPEVQPVLTRENIGAWGQLLDEVLSQNKPEQDSGPTSQNQDAQDNGEMAALLRLKARKDRAKGRKGKAKKAEAQAAAFQESAGTAELDEETARDISELETMVDVHAAGKAAESEAIDPDTIVDAKPEDESENADREDQDNKNEAPEAPSDHEDELILERAEESKETLRQAVDQTQEPTDQTAISLRNEIVNKLRSQDPIIIFSQEEIAWLEANVGDAYGYYRETLDKVSESEPGVTDPIAKDEKNETTSTSEQEYEMTQLEESEIKEIVEKLVLSGDALNGRELTKEQLEELGLNPKTRIILSGQELFISSNSFIFDGKISGLVYYKDGDNYRAVPYMQSSSQSVLRIYPCFTVSAEDIWDGKKWVPEEHIRWFSKGYDEDSLCIPFEAQQILYESSDPISDIPYEDLDLIMIGTAGRFENDQEASERGGEKSGVQRNGRRIVDSRQMSMQFFDGRPEDIEILSEEMKPNFEDLVTSWDRDDDMYGHITYEVYRSNDGTLSYLFCRDGENRPWIGGVQVTDSEKSKLGLNIEWVEGGLLTTPLKEYRKQVKSKDNKDYGSGDLSSYPYDYTFDKFLSKIPVIREYLEHISQRDGVVAPSGKERIVFNRLELDNNGTEINIGDVWNFSSEKGNFSYTIERISEEAGYITITFKNLGSSTYPKHKWKKFFQTATKEVDNA